MRKLSAILSLLAVAAFVAATSTVRAGVNADCVVTIPAGATAGTNTVTLLAGGAPIQRISVAASAIAVGITNTLSVLADDGAVDLAVWSGDLAQAASTTVYPRLHVVDNNSVTNTECYVADTLEIRATIPAATNVASVLTFRIQSR